MTVAKVIALQSFVIPLPAFSPHARFYLSGFTHRQNFEKDLKRAKHVARRPRSALVCIPKTLRQPGDHSCFSRLIFSPPLACVDDATAVNPMARPTSRRSALGMAFPHGRTRLLDHCRPAEA